MLSVVLECRMCGWRTICGLADATSRLRTLGLFRRSPEPPAEMVHELLSVHGARLACDRCRRAHLSVRIDEAVEDGDDWQTAVACEICRRPIPEERLAAVPSATRCAACQDAHERGATPVALEYCPTCGAPLELRVSRRGVTRYRQFCTGDPPCRL